MVQELAGAAVSRSRLNKAVIKVQSCTSTGRGQLSTGQRETLLLTTSLDITWVVIRQVQSLL